MTIGRYGDTAHFLIRDDVSGAALYQAVEVAKGRRGVHKLTVDNLSEWNDTTQQRELNGWRRVSARGTNLAMRKLQDILGPLEDDPNADHNHAKCIADAAAMGVPASWAHMPETYLSM